MAFYEVDDIFFRNLLSVYPYPFAEVDQVRRGVKPDLISRLTQDRGQEMADGAFPVRTGYVYCFVCFMRIA